MFLTMSNSISILGAIDDVFVVPVNVCYEKVRFQVTFLEGALHYFKHGQFGHYCCDVQTSHEGTKK